MMWLPTSYLELWNEHELFNLSSQQTTTDTCANSVDPDEIPHKEPSHQNLHCLPFHFDFRLKPLFASVDVSKFKDGRVHFRNLGVKGLRKNRSTYRLQTAEVEHNKLDVARSIRR